jgi:hypothetical protein
VRGVREQKTSLLSGMPGQGFLNWAQLQEHKGGRDNSCFLGITLGSSHMLGPTEDKLINKWTGLVLRTEISEVQGCRRITDGGRERP